MHFSALRAALLAAPVLAAGVGASLIAADKPVTQYAPRAKGRGAFTLLPAQNFHRSLDEPYELTLHLKSPGLDELEARLAEISLSGGAQPWLTDDETGKYLSPDPAARAELQQWLEAQGLTDYVFSKLGDHVRVYAAQEHVEELFKAPLSLYDVAGKRTVLRSDSYTIPAEIAGLVEHVDPIANFVHPKSRMGRHEPLDMKVADAILADEMTVCNASLVTPKCIRHMYGLGDLHYEPDGKSTDVMVIGYDYEAFSQHDLDIFVNKFNPKYKGWKPKLTYAGNATNHYWPGQETALDVDVLAALIPPLNGEFFLVSGLQGDEILDSLLLVYERPAAERPGVISVSYGPDEDDVSLSVAHQYQKAALKLASVGITTIFASGDWGLNGVQQSEDLNCTHPDRTNVPFPTTPAIFLIGATWGFGKDEHAVLYKDLDYSGFYSGAGYSGLYPVPSYQKAAHDKYTATLPDWERKFFNLTGRIISDAAAIGDNVPSVVEEYLATVGGTSASAPIFASHLAMLNAARRSHGQPTVGYIHPALYKSCYSTNALRDITKGRACGCPAPLENLCLPTDTGYDAPSGLGVPNFPGLLTLFNTTA